MKKTVLLFFALVAPLCQLQAQRALNGKADNIVGTYLGEQKGDVFKARITKASDGTYKGQIFWMENDRQADGSKRLDTKNPDKSLRKVPCDQVVLFKGLKHNAQKQRWDGTKIYDPQRGFTAKMSAEFIDEGTLRITGTVMGLSGHFTWKKNRIKTNRLWPNPSPPKA